MEEDAARPNIRIEIKNNLAEAMEVDLVNNSDDEEGEITEMNDTAELAEEITYKKSGTAQNTKKIWPNDSPSINIFDTADHEKLHERAKRFAIKLSESNSFTTQELELLYESLGVTPEQEKNVRFEAVHMYGTGNMDTDDVLEYFGKYGPTSIEWVTDGSCNVVWIDETTAAKALYFLSRPIKGLKVGGESGEGTSILLKNKDREVEMSGEDDGDEGVKLSDIKVPVPAGYWRLGVEHHKAKSVLLRFVLKTDKKPQRAEKFNLRGKRQKGIFARNRDIETAEPEGATKNPWGNLARNWHDDVRYAEPEYKEKPPPSKSITSPLQHRLGFKRALSPEVEKTPEVDTTDKKIKLPRMRMYADEEEEKIKRKRQLNVLKQGLVKLEKKTDDLRNIIKHDLGTKLRNRQSRDILIAKRFNPNLQMQIRNTRTSPERTHRTHRKERRRHHRHESDEEPDYQNVKTSSKVTVVVKKQKPPTVASAVFTQQVKSRGRSESVSSSASSSSSSSSDEEDESSTSSSEDEESAKKEMQRPGFSGSLKSRLDMAVDSKSPLRIKIVNDQFNKK